MTRGLLLRQSATPPTQPHLASCPVRRKSCVPIYLLLGLFDSVTSPPDLIRPPRPDWQRRGCAGAVCALVSASVSGAGQRRCPTWDLRVGAGVSPGRKTDVGRTVARTAEAIPSPG